MINVTHSLANSHHGVTALLLDAIAIVVPRHFTRMIGIPEYP
jgi:hypothetical protein